MPSPTAVATPAIHARGTSVVLGGRPVVHDVDLDVAPGEVVTLLGANGSGKSTLVRAIVGLMPVARGSVALFGTPPERYRDWSRLGYLPQRTTAASGVPATVTEVVAAGRLSRRRIFRPSSGADRAAVAATIELMGLSALSRRSVSELSGGQQQRVLIARALAGRGDLLVLDEPTAGVDLASQQVFAAAVRQRVSDGAAVLLVSHDLGPLADLIDRAVVLREGRVSYDGPPGDDEIEGHVHIHQHTGDTFDGQFTDPTAPGWLP